MRINEDYLDDIELNDEVLGNTVSANPDERYNHRFIISTGQIIKDKPLDFYLNGLMKYRKTFILFLERARFIDDFNPDFKLHIGWFKESVEYTLKDGTIVLMPQKSSLESIAHTKNPITFNIELAVRLDTLEHIRRTLLYLWKAMEVSLKASFGSAVVPNVIRANDKGEHKIGDCYINKSYINAWTSRSAANVNQFTSAYRYYHPELTNKQIKQFVEPFVSLSGDYSETIGNLSKSFKSMNIISYIKSITEENDEFNIATDEKVRFSAYTLDRINLLKIPVHFVNVKELAISYFFAGQDTRQKGIVELFNKNVFPNLETIKFNLDAHRYYSEALDETDKVVDVDMRGIAPKGVDVKIALKGTKITITSIRSQNKPPKIWNFELNFLTDMKTYSYDITVEDYN